MVIQREPHPSALEALGDEEIDRLTRRLRRQILRRGIDPSTADDLVQEAWLRTMRSPPERSDSDGIGGWLHVVGRRLVAELHRSRGSRLNRELAAARDRELTWEASDSEDEGLVRVLEEQPEPYRSVLRLRFLEDMEAVEIAEVLGRSPVTVRSQLSRGLERLRVRYGADGRPRRTSMLGTLVAILARPWRSLRRLPRRPMWLAVAVIPFVAALLFLSSQSERAGAGVRVARAMDPGLGSAAPVARTPLAPESSPTVATSSVPAPEPLGPRRLVQGSVVAPDGTPASGASIWLGKRLGEGASVGVSDALGGYRVGPIEADGFLWATLDGCMDSTRVWVASIPAGGHHDLRLAASRGALELLLETPGGQPAAGLVVTLNPNRGGLRSIVSVDGALESETRFARGVVTDALGRATLTKPDAYRATLEARREGVLVAHVDLELTRGPQVMELLLPRPGSLGGVVVDGEGRPLAGAGVLVRQLDEGIYHELVTDAGGRFVADGLLPGSVGVVARLGSRTARAQETLGEGMRASVRLTLGLANSVFGTVRFDGQPSAGSEVLLYAARRPLIPVLSVQHTDAEGRFVFPGDPGMRYQLEARRAGETFPIAATPAAECGREVVLEGHSGELARLPVTLEFVSDDPRTLPTLVALGCSTPRVVQVIPVDPATRRAEALLPARSYDLVAWIPGLGHWNVPEPVQPEKGPVRLWVPRPATLELEVELPSGARSRPRAFLKVGGYNPFGIGAMSANATWHELESVADGRFRGVNLAGSYDYLVRAPGCADQVGRVRLEPGGWTRLRETLLGAIDARVTVMRSSEPVGIEGLTLWALGPFGERRVSVADSSALPDGLDLRLALPIGTERLRVLGPGNTSGEADLPNVAAAGPSGSGVALQVKLSREP